MIRLRLVFTLALLLGRLLSPIATEAQEAAKVARIGYLSANRAAGLHLEEAFLQGLRDLGYVEGRNLCSRRPSAAADTGVRRMICPQRM